MKSLLKYLKNYKTESIVAPLFKMLEAIFDLIVPLVVADIIDVGIKNGDTSYILGRCGILVLLAVVGMVIAITAQYFAAKAATGFGKELRHSVFEKVQSLSFSELDAVGTSRLITIISNDCTQVQTGVNIALRLFLRSPFIIFGAMIMAFTVNTDAAVVFVITIPILFAIVIGIMVYTIPKYRDVQNNLDNITLKTRENLSGVRVIRAFTNEENEVNSFTKSNRALSHLQKAVGTISALTNPLTYVVVNIAIVALIYVGAIQVNTGNLTQGEVVALYNYMSQILVEIIKFVNMVVSFTKAIACSSRIAKVLELENTEEHNDNCEIKTDNAVDFCNVSFKYKNASDESLSNISFSARQGDIIGVIGGTGSGKSSLVSLIPHFYDATSGEVLVDGRDVKSYENSELQGKIGFVFQKAALFKGTVRDNLKWGNPNATDDEMNEALNDAQILETVNEKGGLDAEIEQNGANLSGGQKQRLSVARALVKKPQILVLDDSASALDFATEAKLKQAIYDLPYNPTVFIVSQRASSVMNANKIIVLDDGSVVGIGTHDELLENCVVYREIYDCQFGKEGSDE